MNDRPPDGVQLAARPDETMTNRPATAATRAAPMIACLMNTPSEAADYHMWCEPHHHGIPFVSERWRRWQSGSLSWQSFPLECRAVPARHDGRRRRPSRKPANRRENGRGLGTNLLASVVH